MQLVIVAVGQRLPDWVDAAFNDYAKRMPSELKIVLREIKPESRTLARPTDTVLKLEAERIDAAIPKGAIVVALDERGESLTTIDLSRRLDQWRQSGNDVALLIGGADGLAPALKQQAHEQIRLSALTLPHGMARVLLAEALYRAWTVSTGHPYHRA